jgi:hypothetical protein
VQLPGVRDQEIVWRHGFAAACCERQCGAYFASRHGSSGRRNGHRHWRSGRNDRDKLRIQRVAKFDRVACLRIHPEIHVTQIRPRRQPSQQEKNHDRAAGD